jgi:glycine dehydrogenase subunit 2
MAIVKVRRNYHQARWDEPMIFELSTPGVRGMYPPAPEAEIVAAVGDVAGGLPESIRRSEAPALPEVDEKHVLAHYLHLSQETNGSNLHADLSQGTCTMKYNPRVNEDLAAYPRFAMVHPWQDDETIQGILEIFWEHEQVMKAVSGMDRFTLQPGGGAHGVFTAASIIRAYHRDRGEGDQRTEVVTSMFSHPCDAASPATAGYKIVTLMPREDGYPDLEALKAAVGPQTAAIFFTNPEDTGIYNPLIDEFVKVAHAAGAVCFNDQANGNVLMGIARTRDAGFDLCHYNLHKTFGTPHGGSGPGTGAMGCRAEFAKYLPYPVVEKDPTTGRFYLDFDRPDSIGKVKGFLGSAGVVLRAYSWAATMGPRGLKETAEMSALNNNYFMKMCEDIPGLTHPYAEGHRRLEECRWSWQELNEETGVGTDDILRRVGDFGLQHYWSSHHPWVVPEPMTIEPCETFSKEDLEEYSLVLREIAREAREDPESVKNAPHKCAAHKRAAEEELDDPTKWATTWRAYRRKHAIR